VIEEDESHINGLTERNIEDSPQIKSNIVNGTSKKNKKSGSILTSSLYVPPYQKIYSHELP
jgi:hypothetical protein